MAMLTSGHFGTHVTKALMELRDCDAPVCRQRAQRIDVLVGVLERSGDPEDIRLALNELYAELGEEVDHDQCPDA